MMSFAKGHWGKVGVILCGGGCKGVIQPFCLRVLARHGFPIHYLRTNSVGSYNGMGIVEQPGLEGIENTIRIWKEHMNVPQKIYKLHPILEKKLALLIKELPHSPFHHHESFRELISDFGTQTEHMIVALLFWWRAGKFLLRSLGNVELDHPRLTPEMESSLFYLFERFGISDAPAFFDPTPLLTTLNREIDFDKVIRSSIDWHIGVRRFEDNAKMTFSNYEFAGHDPRLCKTLLFQRILASAALYPWFEMAELSTGGQKFHFIDGDIADPVPIYDAFDAGCETVFVLLNIPEVYSRPSNLIEAALEFTNVVNRELINERIRHAQRRAKAEGRNLFVIRPKSLHPDLGLLSISSQAIEFHERQETEATEEYVACLNGHNLRAQPELEYPRAILETFEDTYVNESPPSV